MAALFLTGCGDGELTWQEVIAAPPEPVKVTAEAVEDVGNSRLEVLLQRYGTADFAEDEYIELAELLIAEKRNKEARDALELSCRLQDHPAGYELLQGIVVNLKEEKEEIREMVQLLWQNLGTEELFGEAVGMLYRTDWIQTMMPKMKNGSRKYYQETQSGTLFIQTGYDAYGMGTTTLWNVEGDKAVIIVHCICKHFYLLVGV